ncbi:PVC-type heme-binding CxxCH protein [Planctomicrobium sp. SH527]|uniref:PVC-type heme-binding CxxCH protein n=1 Tax=Planctomicrobium sp. SH527 TaxID=3448123 RepID=UPI003F5CBAC6
MKPTRTLLSLGCGALFTSMLIAADAPAPAVEKDLSGELPRIKPLEVDEAMKTFEIAKGFKLERIAAEPLVNSPVAMCFDENGKLYVVEMIDYSEQGSDHLGQIRVLEDTNQDGIFDKSTVLAEGLSWPTALVCFDGGVFVGAAPDIWYLKDTNGDNKADIKKVVFTGFGRTNVQGLLNSFRWGLDSRIHGATSSSGGKITQPDNPSIAAVELRGRDFSFDPRKLDLRPETGGGQHGMYFDDWGRKFVCSNSQHALFIAFNDRYIARNPNMTAPDPRLNIAIDGGQAPVFRSSPIEPWRIVRTRMRVSGEVKGAIEGGGRAAGYFTGATGITIYRGDALGDEIKGLAFVGDVGSNIVHRKILVPDGIAFQAKRIDGHTEFLRSTDIWFRPVQFANGPDGCLQILDMYREMIEHPASIPEVIKKHLDTSSGQFRGRLYRVTPENYKHRPTPQMTSMSSAELVKLLAHDNSWHRETASRVLYERQDKSIVPQLKEMIVSGDRPLGRLHALSVLDALGELDEASVIAALKDSHPRIRERALIYAEGFTKSPAIAEAISKLATDEDIRVRYQLAFTAGEFPTAVKMPLLLTLLKSDGDDRWIQLAIQSSLTEGSYALFSELLKNESYRQAKENIPVLSSLVQQIIVQNKAQDVASLLKTIDEFAPADKALQDALYTAVLRVGGARVVPQFKSGARKEFLDALIAKNRDIVGASDATVSQRVAAIGLLKLSSSQEDIERLVGLLNPTEDLTVQSAALGALSAQSSTAIPGLLIGRWEELPPAVRTQAEELLFSRAAWTNDVLSRIEDKTLPPASLNLNRLQALVRGTDPKIKERAEKILKSLGSKSRAQVVEQYAGALTKEGDRTRGQAIFRTQCATCHRLENVGFETGSNLASIQNRGKEAILLNVLDPNREVNPEYLNYIVLQNDGRALTGMIRSESATSMNLVRAENQTDSVLRKDIEQIRSSGMSLMPEGMEKQINEQAMADLLTYLLTLDNPAN